MSPLSFRIRHRLSNKTGVGYLGSMACRERGRVLNGTWKGTQSVGLGAAEPRAPRRRQWGSQRTPRGLRRRKGKADFPDRWRRRRPLERTRWQPAAARRRRSSDECGWCTAREEGSTPWVNRSSAGLKHPHIPVRDRPSQTDADPLRSRMGRRRGRRGRKQHGGTTTPTLAGG